MDCSRRFIRLPYPVWDMYFYLHTPLHQGLISLFDDSISNNHYLISFLKLQSSLTSITPYMTIAQHFFRLVCF